MIFPYQDAPNSLESYASIRAGFDFIITLQKGNYDVMQNIWPILTTRPFIYTGSR